LNNLLKYNKLVEQRNSLLKQFAERNYFDKTLIETYSAQLLPLAKSIFEKRASFVSSFIPILENYYFFICNEKEKINLSYISDLQIDDFETVFFNQLQKDLLLQRTTKGIHKDDYIFQISGYPLNKFGSQGQQKSYVIALKLAQFELINQIKGIKPILLLDDIFDKLDDMRIKKLMELMNSGNFGQVFITDARPERTTGLFKEIKQEISLFYTESRPIAKDRNIPIIYLHNLTVVSDTGGDTVEESINSFDLIWCQCRTFKLSTKKR